jgi:hypothetical protein
MDAASSSLEGKTRSGPGDVIRVTLAVIFGIALGYVAYLQLPTSAPREPAQTEAARDLLAMVKQFGVQSEVPPGASAGDYIHPKTFSIAGDTREVLFMHPPSSALFDLWLPDEVRLEFAVGMDPDVWDKPGDGVKFQMEVRDGDRTVRLFSARVDPRANPSDRRWLDASVDLSKFAFQRVHLVLRTLPGASGENDWAGWAGLRMVPATP